MREKLLLSELKKLARQEFDNHKGGLEEGAIDAFPAQELFQLINEETPVNWFKRWEEAGGKFYDTRMIALKTDPIWERVSFFDLPYPPFDEYDVMAVREIGYTEAVKLGVAPSGVSQNPKRRKWSEDLARIKK
jgi:hypothetical protein